MQSELQESEERALESLKVGAEQQKQTADVECDTTQVFYVYSVHIICIIVCVCKCVCDYCMLVYNNIMYGAWQFAYISTLAGPCS